MVRFSAKTVLVEAKQMNDYASHCPEYETWLEGDTCQCRYCMKLDEAKLPKLVCLDRVRNAKRRAYYEGQNKKQTKLVEAKP